MRLEVLKKRRSATTLGGTGEKDRSVSDLLVVRAVGIGIIIY